MRCLRHRKSAMSPPISIGMSSSLQSCSLPNCSENPSSSTDPLSWLLRLPLSKIKEHDRPHTDATNARRQAWPDPVDLRSYGFDLRQVEEEIAGLFGSSKF